jgi:hypothetical protein
LAASAFGCLPAGILMARTKSYRTVLVAALIWCSLFTGQYLQLSVLIHVVRAHDRIHADFYPGLMALLTPRRLTLAYVFSALFGCGTAVTTVIPGKNLIFSLSAVQQLTNRGIVSCCTILVCTVISAWHCRNSERVRSCFGRYHRYHHFHVHP